MDSSKNLPCDFEQLLQKRSLKISSALYSNDLNSNEQSYKPQDVIKSVYSQVKAIQKADCLQGEKCANKDLNKASVSHFLPINKLPVYATSMKESPQTKLDTYPSKLDTQCYLDTQLISILDGVEAIDSNTGMTHEFDTTFAHNDDTNNDEEYNCFKKCPNIFFDNYFIHKDISMSIHSPRKSAKNSQNVENLNPVINENKLETEAQENINILKPNLDHSTDINNTKYNSVMSTTDIDDTETFIQDNILNAQEDKKLMISVNNSKDSNEKDIDVDTGQRSSSPVLSMKSLNKKLKKLSPIVVSLETFENFEAVAMSLIEQTDFNTVKHLINSQILGKELCLNDDSEVLFQRDSPVLDYNSDTLQINSEDLAPSTKKADGVMKLQNMENVNEKHSGMLEDEILFSSDEEDFASIKQNYDHKNEELVEKIPIPIQENENKQKYDNNNEYLPLTCALETSHDEPDILQNTIFVGFQTASNKSIQICKDSFEKAQSIFNDEKNVEEFSLTELVAKCEMSKSSNNPEMSRNSIKARKVCTIESKSLSNCLEDKLEKEKKNKIWHSDVKGEASIPKIAALKELNFKGFQTASNKKINMSDKALEKCREVFQNIDLSENFNTVDIKTKIDQLQKNIVSVENHDEATDDKINDKFILQEFENIEMSLEEKESDIERLEKISFEGFKTAHNKNIKVPEKEIEKTKTLLQDINTVNSITVLETNINKHDKSNDTAKNKELKFIEDINQLSTSSTTFVGFKTANNKEIQISDEALAKTKNVFKDIGKDKKKIKTIEDMFSPLSNSKSLVVFKTASNKHINITDEAMSKTKNVFKDIVKEESKLEFSKHCNKLTSEVEFVGFKTASNKNIRISKAALSKTKNVFEDIYKRELKSKFSKDHNEPLISKTAFIGNDETSTSKAVIVGFKTAGNKVIQISDEALAKTKNIFNDIDKKAKNLNTTHADITSNSKATDQVINDSFSKSNKTLTEANEEAFVQCDFDEMEPIFRGFATPNDNHVTVPKQEIENGKIQVNNIQNYDYNCNMAKNIANKKPVEINNKAINASKEIFYDIDEKQEENSKNIFVGFKTANHKIDNVSEEAMELIDPNIEDLTITSKHNSKFESKEVIFKGFQTANKNKVEISKEAIEKAKNILNDIDNYSKKESKSAFIGFQTASNKKVTVPESALAKSRQLFQDIDNECKTDMPNKRNDIPFYIDKNKNASLKEKIGFQTGRNERIEISEDALKRTKKLFAKNKKDINNLVTDSKNQFRLVKETKTEHTKFVEANTGVVNIENILDTQVMRNFEENLCTEDFRDLPRSNKRSGSPILSCPKAKRRKKFQTPYKNNPQSVTHSDQTKEVKKTTNILTFREDYKKNKKYTLEYLSKLEKGQSKDIDPHILNFDLENMLTFEFDEHRNDLKEGNMTIEEVKQIFTEATDKKLIPDGWLDIHLKLILWKLISYEIRFPKSLGKVCTVRNVIDQLKYRYDKELYNAERPVLRKILEKDDVPNKTMVLCVAGIYVNGVSVISATNLTSIELLLTDGWYFLRATIDNMLSKLVYDGKIFAGSKIVTCGAELVNCEQGVAPWEDISSIRLSISGNSTRPAHWNTKLGLCPITLLSRLKSVRVGGGKVSKIRLRVVRVYPSLYVEKFQDGSTVTRSERLELQYQTKYEAESEAMIEKIYEEVEKEMSDQESQDSDVSYPRSKRRSYETGSQIARMMKASRDPMDFRAQLTSSQVHLLQEHMSRQRDRHLQAIQARVAERVRTRNVVTLARGRVVDVEKDGERVTVTKGMLSIWKPSDEVLDIFKEGSWIEVTNVVPTAFRNSEIQLSAGRQSVFRPLKCKENDIFQPYLTPLSRTCSHIKDISQNPSMTTEYNEIDTVGIIFLIDPSNEEFDTKNQFQNVYLADIDKNMIAVNFWGGIKKFGYESVLDTGQVVYCGNLQKRAGNTKKNIHQYRATEFSIFTKTPKNEQAREIIEEINKKMYGLDRRKFCEDCVAVKQNYSVIRCFGENENVTPYRFNKSDYNLARNVMFIETPVGSNVKSKAEDFNLAGLDFESTFRQQDTQELSPKTLQRKKKVNDKIAKLKMYGEPPPLNPINIINKSKNATNSYKSPLVRNGTSTSNDCLGAASANKMQNIVTPLKLPENCVNNDETVSPVVSINRTYVKRSGVNPVKLNFSENAGIDQSVDHFAEEFDGSPPLSLE